jgi:phosphopantothenoylcysteine synthetase/decarboxylase
MFMRNPKVLITSGGTKIKIDMVRSITNMSRGTFGAKIADAVQEFNDNVTFLCAKNSVMPEYIPRSV